MTNSHHSRAAHWARGRKVGALTAVVALSTAAAGLTPAAADPSASAGASSAPLSVSVTGKPAVVVGGSSASYPSNPGPNYGRIPNDVQLGSSSVNIGGTAVALSQLVKLDSNGLLTSISQATSPLDSRGASGVLGQNGAFPATGDPSQALHIDLLKAGGAASLPAGLVDTATLDLGAFASETSFVNGTLQDPDGVGGPGRYRVGQADLTVASSSVKNAASALYNSLGAVDRKIEQIVNQNVKLSSLNGLLGVALPVPTLTVQSNTRDKVFAKLLAQPLTSHNKLVTIDLSTGKVTIHLDQLTAGGLNAQKPNTELISSKDYPLIAQTVHDLMHDATNIAVGAIENSLDAVKLKLNWVGPILLSPSGLNINWTFTLKQAATGTMPAPVNNSTGLLGSLVGSVVTTLAKSSNLLGTAIRPVYQLVIANAGDGVFDLLINQLKFGFTSSVVNMLQPVFTAATQVISVKVNSQSLGTCTPAGGTPVPSSHSLSALSLSFLKSLDGARLDLGTSSAKATPAGC
ncbi:choice-of-anchor G family protein [Arthrobacter sp. NPDC090010]|uniref:choice-of-anchor G family protein n=1 Tax=Arthrobacter sp. NPDC090010 TaxID=3363942 RepID=UPI0037F42A72